MATRIKEKAASRKAAKDKRPFAIARHIRITPSKAGAVLDLVRGKSYAEAAAILSFKTNSSAPVILKVLNSAAANAENNLGLSKDELYIAECFANPGPSFKRTNIRGRGRADLIIKRTTHIKIILDRKGA